MVCDAAQCPAAVPPLAVRRAFRVSEIDGHLIPLHRTQDPGLRTHWRGLQPFDARRLLGDIALSPEQLACFLDLDIAALDLSTGSRDM